MSEFILALLLLIFTCIGFCVTIVYLVKLCFWIYDVGNSYIKTYNYLKMTEVNEWWASLTVSDKIRIASKVKGSESNYPECTNIWNNLDNKKKQWIKKHCEEKHNNIIPVWQDGNMYSE